MSRCTDIVVTWVLCNLIVIGFLMLFCSWNLAPMEPSLVNIGGSHNYKILCDQVFSLNTIVYFQPVFASFPSP